MAVAFLSAQRSKDPNKQVTISKLLLCSSCFSMIKNAAPHMQQ